MRVVMTTIRTETIQMTNIPSDLVTIDEAARRLHIAARLIRRRVDAQRLPCWVIDGERLVRLSQVAHALPDWRQLRDAPHQHTDR